MNLYRVFVRPILFIFSPEKVHSFTFFMLRMLRPFLSIIHSIDKSGTNEVQLLGLNFSNPVGLAAGLDKDGKAFKSLINLGFGFIELGTVTPLPQAGNVKPRLFRIVSDDALINRMGFNNLGAAELAKRLKNRSSKHIIGGNIGKNTSTPNENAVDDYLMCFRVLYEYVDYFVVNVSCPNIQDLRELQDKDNLAEIINTLSEYRSEQEIQKPILLKVSPDLNNDQLDDIVQVVIDTGVDGLVATNTTIARDNLNITGKEIRDIGRGGLSGSPLRNRSTEVVRYLKTKLPSDFPIIASGGIMSAEDAMEKLEAGAQLVQIYTGFIYKGPKLIKDILKKYRVL